MKVKLFPHWHLSPNTMQCWKSHLGHAQTVAPWGHKLLNVVKEQKMDIGGMLHQRTKGKNNQLTPSSEDPSEQKKWEKKQCSMSSPFFMCLCGEEGRHVRKLFPSQRHGHRSDFSSVVPGLRGRGGISPSPMVLCRSHDFLLVSGTLLFNDHLTFLRPNSCRPRTGREINWNTP